MRRAILGVLIWSQIFTPAAMAECPNAVTLHVGDKVTDCDRVGLALDYNKKVQAALVENEYNKRLLDEQGKLISLKDLSIQQSAQQSELWKNEAQRERIALDKERSRTKWEFWAGIGAGILLTVGAGWAIGQAAKR